MTHRAPVLVADDEPLLREMLRRLLERAGVPVLLVAEAHEVLRLVDSDRPLTAVLLDMRMFPDSEVALRSIRARRPEAGLILISGEFPPPHLQQTLADCSGAFLKKPFAPAALLDLLEGASAPVPDSSRG